MLNHGNCYGIVRSYVSLNDKHYMQAQLGLRCLDIDSYRYGRITKLIPLSNFSSISGNIQHHFILGSLF